MNKYFDKVTKSEAILGIHFEDAENLPSDIVEIPEANVFFKKIPEGKDLQYDSEGIPIGYIDCKTPEEVFLSLTEMEQSDQLRRERDYKLGELQWRLQRCRDERDLGITPTTEDYQALLQYAQDLREIPDQIGFPENVEWPVEP